MQLKPMRIGHIYLYTENLTREERTLTGVQMVEDLEGAVIASAGAHKRVAVIPEGPYILPFP